MADEVDLAAARIEAERQEGIEAVRHRLDGPGREDCRDCDEGIEPERRAAVPSAIRCVVCQERAERRLRQFRSAL